MDTVSIAIIVVVVVGALLFGGNKVRQWSKTAGRAKVDFEIGQLEGATELYEARRKNAEARTAAAKADAVAPPAPPSAL